MYVQLINLDSRPDRLEQVTASAQAAGVRFERLAACNGSLPEFETRAQAIPPTPRGEVIGPRALACTESHRIGWKRFLESDAPYTTMLEDDILMASDLGKILADLSWIPADADIVKLETLNYRCLLSLKTAATVSGRAVRRLRSSQLGTGGYIIGRSGAEQLLAATEAPDDSIDQMMFNLEHPVSRALVIYQMTPAPLVQAAFLEKADNKPDWARSDILDERPDLPFKAKTKSALETVSYKLRGVQRVLAGQARAVTMKAAYVRVPFA